MKITAYNRDHNIDLSGSVGVTSITYASTHTALGSNTPLADSGAGTPGSGPQAAPWDHVHPASASSAFGSNSTRVSSSPAAGASSSNSRADHVHDGIGTATASSSNTLNRGTVHLRPGTGIALALSNTDGGSGFDTVTIQNIASGSSGGGSVSYASNSTRVSSVPSAGASSLVSRGDHVHDGITTSGSVTIPQFVQPVVQTFSAGTTALAVVFGSTPTSGDYLYMLLGSQSRGATGITQTNVTWTNIYTSNDGTRWNELWRGDVSGSAGTTATVAYASSTRTQGVGIEMTNNFTTAGSASGGTASANNAFSTGPIAATAGEYYVAISCNVNAASGHMTANVPFTGISPAGGQCAGLMLIAPTGQIIVQQWVNTTATRTVLFKIS